MSARAIYISPKAIDALFEFLAFINSKKVKSDEYHEKREIVEYLKSKGHHISKSSLDVFIKIVKECQKNNKRLVEWGNTIQVLQ